MAYVYYNPNPSGKQTGDCVIRALSAVLGMSWTEVYDILTFEGREYYDWGNHEAIWGQYLRRIGFRQYPIQDTCPDCYTVEDFVYDHPKGVYVLSTGSHVVAAIDGNYFDAWNSGRECPVVYWSKEER